MTTCQKRVTILGSTGSVGLSTLDVIRAHPDEFRAAGLSAHSNVDLMERQIREFSPEAVYLKDSDAASRIQNRFKDLRVWTEPDAIEAFSASLNSDILMAASTGTSGLPAVLEALKKGRRVALANKEILVMAGSLVMRVIRERKSVEPLLLPVDSEHSAIFQCLQGSLGRDVRKLILTGTGGPLRRVPAKLFSKLSKEQVINHPKWKMGKKISVDSATLMNKGLEIIEASWLFDRPVEQIEVLVHPEAIVHSMVEFWDGSVMAQLGVTDMKLPIRYALSYPRRLKTDESMRLDLARMGALHFTLPDSRKFPCLKLAYEAARQSGSAPCVLSAADEIAVEAFLQDKIPFVDIPKIIENVLSHHRHISEPDLSQIQSAHLWAVEKARQEVLCAAH